MRTPPEGDGRSLELFVELPQIEVIVWSDDPRTEVEAYDLAGNRVGIILYRRPR